MSNKLNTNQEKFIQNIVKGMSQRQAYKEVYNPKYDDNIIDIKACELFNNGKVQVRYKELLEQMQDEAIMTSKERQKWLSDLIKSKEGTNDKLKAIDILNKMTGEYTTKIEGNIGIEKLEDIL